MLQEIFQYLLSKDGKLAKQFGFVHQSIALEKRFKRCNVAWQPHLEKCHQYVRNSVQNTKARSIAILGSGHLYETPLELFPEGTRIDCYDLAFPNWLRKVVIQNPHIRLIQKDLSGSLDSLQNHGLLKIQNVVLEKNYDLAISANIVSQLPFAPIRYLNEKLQNQCDENTLQEVGIQIIRNHLALLKSQSNAIFICDHHRRCLDRSGHELESYSTVLSEKLPKAEEQWTWEISPFGESSSNYQIILDVIAGKV